MNRISKEEELRKLKKQLKKVSLLKQKLFLTKQQMEEVATRLQINIVLPPVANASITVCANR
ncbi:MAG: hypothetical protein R3B39_01640 [Candidatus Paceibacterota bacterium]